MIGRDIAAVRPCSREDAEPSRRRGWDCAQNAFGIVKAGMIAMRLRNEQAVEVTGKISFRIENGNVDTRPPEAWNRDSRQKQPVTNDAEKRSRYHSANAQIEQCNAAEQVTQSDPLHDAEVSQRGKVRNRQSIEDEPDEEDERRP